jgi:hypothetical protein
MSSRFEAALKRAYKHFQDIRDIDLADPDKYVQKADSIACAAIIELWGVLNQEKDG